MTEYSKKIVEMINILKQDSSISSFDMCQSLRISHDQIVGILTSLSSRPDFIKMKKTKKSDYKLTAEGCKMLKNGSYEFTLFNSVPNDGILLDKLKTSNNSGIGLKWALSNGWIKLEKIENQTYVKKIVSQINDHVITHLNIINSDKIDEIQPKILTILIKRKLVSKKDITIFLVSPDTNFAVNIENLSKDLTMDMINAQDWSNYKFKEYNFAAEGLKHVGGNLHPLMKMRQHYRSLFLRMGFSEMPTNQFVESSFWNFDALFQPQKHPSRDLQDTFFTKEPSKAQNLPNKYVKIVAKVHSTGGYGSIGYNYNWKLCEAEKLVLRTHTTATTTKMLYNIAQKEKFEPAKLFSIDRVFRNETLDSTHLAEFHQVEGVVVDYNLTLGNLMAIISHFFEQLGMTKLRYKPAYNPYTEPSMEIFSYHDGLKKWVEIGNSGMFRQEMLRSMGFDENVTAIAWGLSLERPTMIKYNISNIRDMFGSKVKMSTIYNQVLIT